MKGPSMSLDMVTWMVASVDACCCSHGGCDEGDVDTRGM
jgi:hypothetical protein